MLFWHQSRCRATPALQGQTALCWLDTLPQVRRWSIRDIWCGEGSQIRATSSACSSKCSLAAFVSSRDFGRVVYVAFHSFPREPAMHSDVARDLWIPMFKNGEGKLTNRAGKNGLQGICQSRSHYPTIPIWKMVVIRCGQDGEELPRMSDYDD